MSMFRIAAVAALALAVSARAFANENDSPEGRFLGQGVAVSQGVTGAGQTGENASAIGDVFAQSIAVSQARLSGFAESLALTNNATASDIQGVSLAGRLAAR